MGAVRTLLAIAAIVTHTGPLFPCVTMISGNLAVQAFFGSILVSIVLLVATHPIEQSRARLAQEQAPALAYPLAEYQRGEPVAGGRRLCEGPAAQEPELSLCQQRDRTKDAPNKRPSRD
jgi:hypothetical protein